MKLFFPALTQTLTVLQDNVVDADYSHDGEWVLSASKDRSVYFWDPKTGVPHMAVLGHKKAVIKVVVFPKKDLPVGEGIFATVSADRRVRIWRYYPYKK